MFSQNGKIFGGRYPWRGLGPPNGGLGGFLLPQGACPAGMHPPFLFWSCQKRNGPCTVQREKTLRRVGLRRRRPPAAGGGWLALPCRSQGRKRAALGETFGPGKFGIPSASLPAAAHAPTKSSQRQRKEKQLDATTTPTRPAPSATGRQLQTCRRPKRARRPGKIGAGTDTPTPVARRATAPECA